MEHIETEYKWAVNKRSDFKKLKNILAAQGWDCAFYAPVLLDSYFDAPGGALSAEKSALRLRKTVLDGKTFYELTLKINRALSVYVDVIDTEIENYTSKWLSYGFEESALLIVANHCFRASMDCAP